MPEPTTDDNRFTWQPGDVEYTPPDDEDGWEQSGCAYIAPQVLHAWGEKHGLPREWIDKARGAKK